VNLPAQYVVENGPLDGVYKVPKCAHCGKRFLITAVPGWERINICFSCARVPGVVARVTNVTA